MPNLERKQRRINPNFTKRLISLHHDGYENDFFVLENNVLLCIQGNHVFPFQTVSVRLIDQAYDCLSGCFKYIHTVDTDSGDKGVLVSEGIFMCMFNSG